MKKWCIAFLLCCFITILWNQNEKLEPVFQENYLNKIDENSFELVQVDVSEASITTKNLTSLLEQLSLITIEYEIPKLYQSKFSKSEFIYHFENQSYEKGLNEIETFVKKRWKQLGQQKEIEKIYFYGIKINMVEVCGPKEKIDAFKQRIKNS